MITRILLENHLENHVKTGIEIGHGASCERNFLNFSSWETVQNISRIFGKIQIYELINA